jgi:predicted nucleic acid-binding protein
MALTVIDSSWLIDALDGTNKDKPFASLVAELVAAGQFVTNVIIRYEVLIGERHDSPAYAILAAGPCRVLDAVGLERALAIGLELRDRGISIGPHDTIIAALALLHDDEVLTSNRGHFEFVNGLKIHPASIPAGPRQKSPRRKRQK